MHCRLSRPCRVPRTRPHAYREDPTHTRTRTDRHPDPASLSLPLPPALTTPLTLPLTRFTSYLYKINVITAVQSIVTMAPPPAYLTEDETRLTDLLELVCKAAVHTTPNVRLIAANALGAIGKSASEGLWAADRAAQVEMQIR